jgi:hypothetical protein
MTDNFIIVSFFTKEYCNEAIRLIDSLERLDIRYDIVGVSSRGSWIANVNYKAAFCRDKMNEHDIPIVWVDCDAEVQSYPVIFDEIKEFYDIGVFYRNRDKRPRELLSGTLYFNNTIRSKELLEAWTTMCRIHDTIWDQRNLHEVIEQSKEYMNVFEFPSSYVRIFDAEDMRGVEPVILHHQASRRLKRIVT